MMFSMIRRTAMSRFTFLVLLLLCARAACAVPGPQGVDLARMVDWDIVVAEDAIPSEIYAAEELRDHMARATGVRLPIVTEAERPDRHVFVGASPAMQASTVGFRTDEFGPEDLRIIIRDANIAIAGGRPRGTLYGVYSFLEDHLSVRFLTRDHTQVPPVGPWRVVGPVDRFYHPPLGFRWSYYGETNRHEAFAARIRCNTVPKEQRLGGKSGRTLINHSFGNQISSQEYGKGHPEYFCLIDGTRRAEVKSDWYDNEPCLSNGEVLEIVTDAVLKELEKNPERENISVSQNDNDKYCRCERCVAIDDREGTPMGSLLTFVNGVADEVAKHHPDVKVGTLAYWYTRQRPANVKPRSNVQIQLCSIECSVVQPLDDPDCKLNVAFCKDFRDWSAVSDDIAVWNYNTNFSNYLLPCPNLRVIEPNIRFFLANNVKGVFMQGAGNAVGGEFSDLRNYIMSGLLWDPNRRGRELMEEFLTLHYGRAAPPIRRFINLVHDHAEASGITKNCFGSAADYGIDADIIAAGLEAFDEARRLADSPALRRRVEKASICAYRAAIEDAWLWAQKHRDEIDQHPMPEDIAGRTRPHARALFERCAHHGVDRWSEGTPIEDAQALLRAAYGLRVGERW
jgi:hypothetical protein